MCKKTLIVTVTMFLGLFSALSYGADPDKDPVKEYAEKCRSIAFARDDPNAANISSAFSLSYQTKLKEEELKTMKEILIELKKLNTKSGNKK